MACKTFLFYNLTFQLWQEADERYFWQNLNILTINSYFSSLILSPLLCPLVRPRSLSASVWNCVWPAFSPLRSPWSTADCRWNLGRNDYTDYACQPTPWQCTAQTIDNKTNGCNHCDVTHWFLTSRFRVQNLPWPSPTWPCLTPPNSRVIKNGRRGGASG